ncbi:NUDIX domain-containing protein [Schaalia hyovaginalis]|uniref:NUDIX domain-containing protein n=1 Tax=Schaalia hyovaginalis TaxID=29316 RepID=UPI0026F0F39D|nr:NUDIX domain-containing protein [Schaalia hyovaginalis]MCI6410647.1 NUDIX domain-containing protein [Schaalia hyovaginalis]
MKPAPVVAAAILDSLESPSRLLCAARAYPAEIAGRFELPGGKIDPGEEPLEALAREIEEELGTALIFGAEIPSPEGGWWPILGGRDMGVWLAEVAPGSPAPRAGDSHSELRWVDLEDAEAVDWIGADLPIVRAVREATRAITARLT